MSGYAFHPDAFADLDEIWRYIPKPTSWNHITAWLRQIEALRRAA